HHRNASRTESEMSIAGSGFLPVAKVPVTRRSILDLAEMDEVVAILPNLKVEAILPRSASYSQPDHQERKEGVTWGIRELGIDRLWQSGHAGEDVRIAVLDTGVHGSHFALQNKVERFVVVDPLVLVQPE